MRKALHSIIGLIIIFLVGLVACNGNYNSQKLSVEVNVLNKISDTKGQYIWNDKLKRHLYSKKNELEAIVLPIDQEEALAILVNCLDKSNNSSSTLDGKRVMLGVICYEALSQLVYHEPTNKDGDIRKKWTGHISPTATEQELKAAKEAWLKVLHTKTYIFL